MQEEQPFFNEYPPIRNGEIFDAEKAIRTILKAPKEERRQKLAEFKEKLAFQQVGLARVQDIIIDEIRRKPDGKMDDFFDLATEMGAEFGMNETQKKIVKEAIFQYEKQHKSIEKIRKAYKKDEDLFKELFWKQPKGKIEIITGPVSLYFKCYDFEDYLTIFYSNQRRHHGKKRDFTEEEKRVAKAFGAATVPHPILGKSIFAENRSKTDSPHTEEESQQIFIHEEQHIIKKLFDKEDLFEPDDPITLALVSRNFLSAENDEEKEEILRGFFLAFRYNAEERAKDEFLAYYKEGEGIDFAHEELAVSKEEGGLYDYLAKPEKLEYEWLNANDETRALAKKVANRIFKKEYKEILEKGAEAIQKMEEAGYEKEEIIALLTHEPLARWGKVVGRVLESDAK